MATQDFEALARRCEQATGPGGDIVPGGEEEMTLVVDLHAIVAECSNPECYICEEVGKAADRIKALEADNLRLREIEIAARTLLCCIDTGDYYNNIDTHVAKLRAALSSEPKQEQGE